MTEGVLSIPAFKSDGVFSNTIINSDKPNMSNSSPYQNLNTKNSFDMVNEHIQTILGRSQSDPISTWRNTGT